MNGARPSTLKPCFYPGGSPGGVNLLKGYWRQGLDKKAAVPLGEEALVKDYQYSSVAGPPDQATKPLAETNNRLG
ncbi:glucan phosphorylase [Moorella thermoacetica Y72]|uniref:Glucan phosphorylase n=1 Tax=Moorella thermoacetica Y72 TaxID=1325331 RepID=A0A0S6UFD0_NEOTH|nr:glucan phosphorylase [Moorella thermoacetica Y72]